MYGSQTGPGTPQPQPSGGGDILSTLVNVGGAIANSLINANAQKKAQKRQQRYDKRQTDYEFQKNLEMWNLQNEYNTPANQMSRYQAAGVNPAQIYGSGSGSSGNAASAPTYQAPRFRGEAFMPIEIPNMLSMYQDFRMRNAQIDAVKANTINTETRTLNEGVKTTLNELAGERGRQKFSWEKEDRPYQAQQLQFDTERSGISRDQAWQKLANMKSDELSKALTRQAMQKRMDQMDLYNEKIQADTLFRNYQNQFLKNGVTTSDNVFVRILARMMSESDMSIQDFTPQKGANWDKYIKDK